MNLIAITIAFVVLVAGAYIGKKEIANVAETQVAETQNEGVLSTQDETISEGDSNVSVDISNTVDSETPTSTPTRSPSLSPSPTTTSQSSSLDAYLYPGATVVSRTNTTVSLRSASDTDAITNWYKDKIRQEGMNVKTFVTTKANDKVVNKLVGANGAKDISVEIKKDPGQETSAIEITITSN